MDGVGVDECLHSLILRNLANLSKLVFVFSGNLSWVSQWFLVLWIEY